VGRGREFVVDLRTLVRVDERDAVESMQAIAVCDRSAFAARFVSDRARIDGVAVEEGDAEAVRRVEEPGIGVRDRKNVRARSLLEAEAEVLALAEEVARRELRLHEESAALGV